MRLGVLLRVEISTAIVNFYNKNVTSLVQLGNGSLNMINYYSAWIGGLPTSMPIALVFEERLINARMHSI